MTVKELIKLLEGFKPSAKVLVSSDEEMNTLYGDFGVSNLENKDNIVIYGLDGHEVNDFN